MSVPKFQLDLDELDANDDKSLSLVDAALANGVEEEKCVIGLYRTTNEQKVKFQSLVNKNERTAIPIEWVIDIADESNGWFYATAYHYDDVNQTLHVMVPDKENPTFDGYVQLDHRTVHLIEAVDQASQALFNKIIRDSVIKIKWEVEWLEENESSEPKWIPSMARYYIQMSNQLLVEDEDMGQEARGFVIITADVNVKLLFCHRNKGIEDFARLIKENVVLCSPEAQEIIENYNPQEEGMFSPGSVQEKGQDNESGLVLRKIGELTRNLKVSLSDIILDHDNLKNNEDKYATLFQSFTLDGDLEDGLKLMNMFQQTKEKPSKEHEEDEDKVNVDQAIADANYCINKLDKHVIKLLKGWKDSSGNGVGSSNEDIEALKKNLKKLKKELEERDKELKTLRPNRRG